MNYDIGRLYFILFILLFSISSVQAQKKDSTKARADTLKSSEPKPEKIYETFDDPPIPPGGDKGYAEYLRQNIINPKEAIAAQAYGKVLISITVDIDGTLSDVHVIKDGAGYGCGEEAVRVIKKMPPWSPAKLNGVPVKARYIIPVKIDLLILNDSPPEPPGGEEKFVAFLENNLNYPQDAANANAKGIVRVSIVVNTDGTLSDVHVVEDNVGYGCAAELVRVIKMLPPWKPGTMNGIPVKVHLIIPWKFD